MCVVTVSPSVRQISIYLHIYLYICLSLSLSVFIYIHICLFTVLFPRLIIADCIHTPRCRTSLMCGSASLQGVACRHSGTKCWLIKILLLIYESECVQTCPHTKLTPSSIMDALTCVVHRRFLTFWVITLLWKGRAAERRAEAAAECSGCQPDK